MLLQSVKEVKLPPHNEFTHFEAGGAHSFMQDLLDDLFEVEREIAKLYLTPKEIKNRFIFECD